MSPRFASRLGPDELARSSIDRAALRRVLRFATAYRRQLVVYGAIIVVTNLMALGPPLLFKSLIDFLQQHQSAPGQRGVMTPAVEHRLLLLFGLAVGLAIATTGVNLVSRWLGSVVGEGLIHDLRVALFEKVQRMPIAFFTRTQTGSLLSRLSNDVIGAQGTVGTGATVLDQVVGLTSVLTTMFVLSWKVTALALLVVPLFLVTDRVLGRRLAAMSRRRMDQNADLSSTLAERFNVSGAQLVKLFGRPAEETAAFAVNAAAVRDSGITIAVYGRLYYGLLALAGSLGTAAVYWFGGRAVLNDGLQLGTLTALAAFVTKLYSPLTTLASARTDLLTALVSFDRCFEVLDAPIAIDEKPNAVVLGGQAPVIGRVDVDHVVFRFPAPSEVSVASLEAGAPTTLSDEPSAEILHDVSFVAQPGQLVALVGHSGAGKTTLASLIPRLHDVTGGAVRIDGIDVRDLTLQSLVDAVGVVSQDPHMFHDSIMANLRYGRPEATDADVVAACRGARIHDVIASLPEGYDTVVGERGYRLSGGEKQRLAIARVLLKQPAIVVLDEATSHLDSENEAAIQEALREALVGRTAIVIAHRLSTVQDADLILVIDEGRIVERGTHDELLRTAGVYADLFEVQHRGAIERA